MCVLVDPGRRALGQLWPLGRPLAGCRSWTRARRPESQSPQAGGSGDGDPRPGLVVSPVSKQASVQAGGGWGRRRRTRLGHRHSEVHAGDSTLLPALTSGPCLLEENQRACEDVSAGHTSRLAPSGPFRPPFLWGEPHSSTASLSRPPALLHPSRHPRGFRHPTYSINTPRASDVPSLGF